MTEQQKYEVVEVHEGFELRRYPEHVVAEVEMTGAFERAGNAGFGPLVSYISGRNRTGAKVAMTAPVIQETVDERQTHLVSFVMPDGATVDRLPEPASERIRVHEVPEQLAAASTYSGRWTEASYLKHVDALLAAVAEAGLEVAGRPRYARFDPPWKPPFLRRNEVVIPVARP
jgi:effector-binding domain-containing protein